MKYFIIVFISLTFVLSMIGYGQVPNKISYQGILTTSSGSPVADGTYDIQFDIYDDPTGGSLQHTETHTSVSVQRGTFNVILGPFAAIFDKALYVEVTAAGGPSIPSPITFSPRSELTSAPYSLSLSVPSTLQIGIADYEVLKIINTKAGTGLRSECLGNSTSPVYGIYSLSENAGAGEARGGFFTTSQTNRGTGTRFGIDAVAWGGGAAQTFAVKGWCSGNSTGENYGGYFTAWGDPSSSGKSTGAFAEAFSRGTAPVTGVYGFAENSESGTAFGGRFYTSMYTRTTGDNYGVVGSTFGAGDGTSYGVFGVANHASTGKAYGGYFEVPSTGSGEHYGIFANAYSNSTADTYGSKIEATNSSSGSTYGTRTEATNSSTGNAYGGYFLTSISTRGTGGYRIGIFAAGLGNSGGDTYGVSAIAENTGSGDAYAGIFQAYSAGTGIKYGVYAQAPIGGSNRAGYFWGDVTVTGTMSKGGGAFKIDHPLDPANKYLFHSFVESPDMMNVYNGNVMLNAGGEAWIELPSYFEALNKDFRYQLTAIGTPSPNLYVAEKISNNRFRIAGGNPNGEVSWQVTGIRNDKYAQANRIITEVEKSGKERGKYIHPEVFGLSDENSIQYEIQKKMAEHSKAKKEE